VAVKNAPEGGVRARPGVVALESKPFWALGETLVQIGLFLAAAFAILATLGIALSLLQDSILFFARVNALQFFLGTVWSPDIDGLYGVLPLVAGTFMIAGGAALIGIPIGLSAAIYLREYAPPRIREFVKPVLEILAGIPSIVYGFFAILTISPILQAWFTADYFNAANGIIVIGIMILPMVSSLSEDALTAVPTELRDGALALGATRFEAMRRVVVPAAFSGVAASFLLAFSRAVGETMVVVIATGQNTQLSLDIFRQMTTLSGFIAKRATGDLPTESVLFQSLFAVGFTLFLITLVLNLISDHLRSRLREAYA
jgi:phosphate transport system permease protein